MISFLCSSVYYIHVLPYLIFLHSVHMCGIWNLNPQLKIFILSITLLIARSDLCIHCLATCYLEFQIGQPLTSCFFSWTCPRSFLYYAGNFSYYAGVMLYTFQPLLFLKLCRHNWLKPNTHTHAHTHTHTHIHTHIYTHTHTYTHTYRRQSRV